jgi:hypothetical protein
VEYRATIQKVVPEGRHGPFAVALAYEDGRNITFSLDKPVWQGESLPEPGTIVMLSQLSKKWAGWRASSARLFQPADEQQ